MTAKPEESQESTYGLDHSFELILFNDDVNTFEFVIDKLMEYCDHSAEQAEQCALITHHRGECNILVGCQEHVSEVGFSLGAEGLIVDIRKLVE